MDRVNLSADGTTAVYVGGLTGLKSRGQVQYPYEGIYKELYTSPFAM